MPSTEKQVALAELVGRVVMPYFIVAVLLVLLGIFIRYSPLPEIDTENETPVVAQANSGKKNIFQFPHLILGVVALFFHVGTQIISIDTIISYANSMHIGLLEAKVFPSYTLAATIVSYVVGIVFIPRYFSQLLAFRVCVLLGLVLSAGILLLKGNVNFLGHHADISIWMVATLGLANGLVWPGIWSVALTGLGRFTKLGGSLLVMGLVGNAIMPSVYGLLADQVGGRMAYSILIPCYLFLVYYSFRGYKLKKW
jgi:fucose permease